MKFFEQVFIDSGAVAWPGEIDLAPDATYAQVTSRSQLPRLYELKDLLCDPCHPDACFQNFEDHLRHPACLAAYATWEKVLQGLDPAAWLSVRRKANAYVSQMGPPAVRNAANQLDGGFFRKLDSDIACAKNQLQSYDPSGSAKHLVYINICFDDFFCPYQEDYLKQIKEHLLKPPPGIKVVVSFDFSKTETHVVAQ